MLHLKKLTFLLVLLIMNFAGNAQQNPQFSQYIQNPIVINPAMTGVEEYLDVTLGYRNQWTGFEGAPKTGTLSINAPLNLFSGQVSGRGGESHQGIGAMAYTDETGPIKKSGIFGAYAYHLKLSNDFFVSFGTFLGINNFSFDETQAVLVQNPNDIVVQNINSTSFDASVGMYVYSSKFFAGISANQILDNEINPSFANNQLFEGKINRNFNALLGTRLEFNYDWKLIPSILVKTVENAPVQFDLNAKMYYKDKIWGGISYRNEDAIVGIFGIKFLENLWAGYSYDYSFSDLSGLQSGSHEILIGYRFDFGNQKCHCPQYSM